MIGIAATLAILLILSKFLPVVSELPFGMDEALIIFTSTVRGIIEIMPWLGIVWFYILLALFIKGLMFTFHWSIFFLNLFAGGSGAPKK